MTVSTAGAPCATSVRILRFPLVTWLPEPWDMKTWMTMACGARLHRTGRCGFQVPCLKAGLLISMVTGSGLSRGAGPGSMTRPGDMLPSTTAAGSIRAATGDGHRDRSMRARYTHPRWWRGLAARAGARTSASDSAADWDGARWAGVSRSIRGMAEGSGTSAA